MAIILSRVTKAFSESRQRQCQALRGGGTNQLLKFGHVQFDADSHEPKYLPDGWRIAMSVDFFFCMLCPIILNHRMSSYWRLCARRFPVASDKIMQTERLWSHPFWHWAMVGDICLVAIPVIPAIFKKMNLYH